MFESFTAGARGVVEGAVRQADRLGTGTVGEQELLLSLLERTDSPAADVLAALGVDERREAIEHDLEQVRRRGGISPSDAEALAGLGIDVAEVVARVEAVHGKGALAASRAPRRRRGRVRRPFTPEARSVLEKALHLAVGRHEKRLGDEHLLLALTARPGVAARVLADHGVTYVEVERVLASRTAPH